MNATIFRRFYTKNNILNIFISKNKTADKKNAFCVGGIKEKRKRYTLQRKKTCVCYFRPLLKFFFALATKKQIFMML